MSNGNGEYSRLRPLIHLANNPISFIGVLLTTTGAVSWFFTLPAHFSDDEPHPYLALLAVFGLPLLFFMGLALIPLGIRLKERKEKRTGMYPSSFPPLSLKNTEFRNLLSFVGLTTFANVVIGGHLTLTAVQYMDSNQFCGAQCHVMTPEFTAFDYAPHSQIGCVDCHVGAGARSLIAAKLNGLNQLYGVTFNNHPRPVPTPVHNLAQGLLTCGKCHSDRDFGSKRKEWIMFGEDEANSALRTELLVKIGGGRNLTGAHGAHVAQGAKVEYRSDPERTKIPWMRYTAADGSETVYATGDWDDSKAEELELRQMDCTDCHNRAAHSLEAPHKAIDESIAAGRISSKLPRIKQKGLELIRISYESQERAGIDLPEALGAFYQADYPAAAGGMGTEIDQAADELLAIYRRNIFPEWKVEWGTHPNQLGHEDYPGCYRCHDKAHVSLDSARRPMETECSNCHEMLVVDQPVSAPTVELLTRSPGRSRLPGQLTYQTQAGPVPFDHAQHVDLENNECTACHNSFFPMRKAPLNYADDLHQTAEANKSSCAGCHVAGGSAFASAGKCRSCHTNLSAPTRVAARTGSRARDLLPGEVAYDTDLGRAAFDHEQHVDLAKGKCTACHNNLFPMAKGPLNYGDDLHKTAEGNKASCAGCHVAGGEAFEAAGNCSKCHIDLGAPRSVALSGQSGVPGVITYATKLGDAPFDHEKHLDYAQGECKACHTKLFGLERGQLWYADDIHRTAEANQASCGGCHVAGGEAFASKGKCLECHTGLAAAGRGSEMGLPATVVYENRLGDVAFNHDEHINDAKGDCSRCHDSLFAWERSPLKYADDYHRTAEAQQASCAGCHVDNGESFTSLENCDRCHQGLELQRTAD